MKMKLTTGFSSLITTLVLIFIPRLVEANISFEFQSFIGVTSFEGLLVAILNILIVIATPIVVLFIIYSGFMYVTARGNAQQVEQATRSLTYAIIGGVLILGAVAISQVLKNVVDSFSA